MYVASKYLFEKKNLIFATGNQNPDKKNLSWHTKTGLLSTPHIKHVCIDLTDVSHMLYNTL